MSLFSRFNGKKISGLAVGGLLILLLWATNPLGEELSTEVSYVWPAPLMGSPVVHYVLELEQLRGEIVVSKTVFDSIPENIFPVPVEMGLKYHIRVAGVDAQGRQGPWSDWSDVKAPPERTPDDPPND